MSISNTPLSIPKLQSAAREVSTQDNLAIVIVGHVDHGKSTIIGRLLADTNSLPEGKLEQVRETCRRNSKPFEYAFLLDALKDEQAQGITIDSARCFFKTKLRKYLIIDAPGHIELLKNTVSGASRADAALLVIDAVEGIQENTRRHAFMLSMLGIKQIVVLINKMDQVNYSSELFDGLVNEYRKFLKQLCISPLGYIPVSGFYGDNIAKSSARMPWYQGDNVLTALDKFIAPKSLEGKPLRMPVQGVYKFTNNGDNRRIIAGTIESGRLKIGAEVIFYPSGKKSIVQSIETFAKEPPFEVMAGQAAGFTLKEQIYVTRGEIVALSSQPKPCVSSRFKASIFWLGHEPLYLGKTYYLKLGTAKVPMRLESILRIIDSASLEMVQINQVERHAAAECIFKLERAVAFDLVEDNPATGRFVIINEYEITGGGIILDTLEDQQTSVREQVLMRNFKWEKSLISEEERSERYFQKSVLILITGPRDVGKKTIAKAVEKQLFQEGKFIYFLGIGNVLYGVDADIKLHDANHRAEHMRRLAEVANILLDAGLILIVTAVCLTQEDLEAIKTIIRFDKIVTVWIGEQVNNSLDCDLQFPRFETKERAVDLIKIRLQNLGII